MDWLALRVVRVWCIVWVGFCFCFGFDWYGNGKVKKWSLLSRIKLLSFFYEVSKPTIPCSLHIVNIQIHIRYETSMIKNREVLRSRHDLGLFSRFGWLPSQWNICIIRNSSSSSSSRLERGKVA
jgi:hypothetical protein